MSSVCEINVNYLRDVKSKLPLARTLTSAVQIEASGAKRKKHRIFWPSVGKGKRNTEILGSHVKVLKLVSP